MNDSKLAGFLLVGHGTRQIAGQDQLRQVFADFVKGVDPCPAELAFLELAEPDIPTAVERLAALGVREVITVPVLLFTAGHAQRDIPEAVEAAANRFGIRAVDQTPSLHDCAAIVELSAIRFREAVCMLPSEVECSLCLSGCSGRWCSQAGMLMVGRGSSSDEATQAMRQFTSARLHRTPMAWSQTAFIHGQSPTVDEGLDQLAQSGLPIAVVQPHLLFEGELIQTLRRQVAERADRHPNQRWVITSTLGTDERLAQTLATTALQQAAGRSR